jgi:UDP-glucose 4-epimerase
MKAIVTGGCGFIGSHLTELLINKDFEVIVIDNLSNGRLDNIKHIKSKKLEVIIEDINNYDKIYKYFKGVDYVFHLAALADIVPSIENPVKYHNSNVNGTISILEASRKNNISKFIYAASSSCYGIPEEYPTKENAKINTKYPYATTKYLAEEYVMNWNKIYDLPTVSLRFFNVYGTRSRTSGTYGAVFGVFLAQKINKKPFTIVGDGEQTRDFTYVTDVANACFCAAEDKKSVGKIYNVGSGNTYSINYLTSLLRGEKVFIPKRPGEPDCTFADISKIKKDLGWEPKIGLEDGVKKMLDNIHYWKEAPLWNKKNIEMATKSWFKYLK